MYCLHFDVVVQLKQEGIIFPPDGYVYVGYILSVQDYQALLFLSQIFRMHADSVCVCSFC
jgi:hypothetical protein